MAVSPIPLIISGLSTRNYVFAEGFRGYRITGLPRHYHVVGNYGTTGSGYLSLRVINALGADISSLGGLLTGTSVPAGLSVTFSLAGSTVAITQMTNYRLGWSGGGSGPTYNSGGYTLAINAEKLRTLGQRPYGWIWVENGSQRIVSADSCVMEGRYAVYTLPGGGASPTVQLVPISVDFGGTVTFDPNGYTGITIIPPSKEVWKGEAFGDLPTPTYNIEGLNFLGWFTEPEGGSEVTADTIVTQESDFSLYAHWEYSGYKKHLVVLDAAGGTSSVGTIEVEVGGTYAALPTPTRDGYDFGGWFTEPEGDGQKITNSTVVADPPPETLFADWSEDSPEESDDLLLFDPTSGYLIYDDRAVAE